MFRIDEENLEEMILMKMVATVVQLLLLIVLQVFSLG